MGHTDWKTISEVVDCPPFSVYDSTATRERLIASSKLLMALVFYYKSREKTVLALKILAPERVAHVDDIALYRQDHAWMDSDEI